MLLMLECIKNIANVAQPLKMLETLQKDFENVANVPEH